MASALIEWFTEYTAINGVAYASCRRCGSTISLTDNSAGLSMPEIHIEWHRFIEEGPDFLS